MARMLTVSDKPIVSMVTDPSVSPATDPSTPKLLSQVTAVALWPVGKSSLRWAPTEGMAVKAPKVDTNTAPAMAQGSSSQ